MPFETIYTHAAKNGWIIGTPLSKEHWRAWDEECTRQQTAAEIEARLKEEQAEEVRKIWTDEEWKVIPKPIPEQPVDGWTDSFPPPMEYTQDREGLVTIVISRETSHFFSCLQLGLHR